MESLGKEKRLMVSTLPEHARKDKRQLKHVLIDVDFFSNPKVVAVGRKFGDKGIIALLEVYAAMSRATNALICEDAFCGIAEMRGVAEVEAFLTYLLDHGLVSKDEKTGKFTNERVEKDQEAYALKVAKLEKDSARKKGKEVPRKFHGNSTEKDVEDPVEIPGIPVYVDDNTNKIHLNTTKIESNNYFNSSEFKEPVRQDNPKTTLGQLTDTPEDCNEEIWAQTLDAFELDSEQLNRDNRFLLAGRMPLKKYPEIWLTQFELYNWLRSYLEAGVPKALLKNGFLKVQARLKTWQSQGKRLEGVSAFNWGIGFVLREVLDELRASTDLKRSETYLEGARR